MESLLEDFFIVWTISASIMLFLWLSYLITKEPAIVDVGWGASIGLSTYGLFYNLEIANLRSLLVLFCVLLWSIRISALLLMRLYKGLVDKRYIELSGKWKKKRSLKYFIFFQAQALTVPLLLIPVSLAFHSLDPLVTIWDTLGILLFLMAFTGEVIADKQMADFRNHPDKNSKVCSKGLWKYSRHPNYFFESLIWLSYSLMAMNSPLGLISLISPALITFSILKVTGIPPTEESLLCTKGEAYRAYQATTSAFIPWLPKKPNSD
ncbi:MAG: DUF1295 domain-containing protein [Chlamydiales bacterium]|nr:DUF1295 domain-containing protein [Chlamydiales bacterium]